MQVLFKLRRNYRKTKKGKPKPSELAIYARITVNGETADISCNVKVHPANWNQTKQRITEGSPFAKEDNKTLDRVKTKLKKAFNLLDDDDVHVTASQVIDVYRGQKRIRYTTQAMLAKLMDDLKDRISDDPADLASGKDFITEDTFDTYQKYSNNILEFLVDTKQQRGFIDEIDEAWLNEFKAWGQRRFATNYLAKHLYHVKKLLDFSVLKKAVRNNPIKPYRIDREEPDPDENVFLSPTELANLTSFDFKTLPIKAERAARLDRLRDAYLFMQAIGTHYGEYQRFVSDPEKMLHQRDGIWFLKTKRSKTKKYLVTPLKDINFSLAAKYGGFDKLPVCSRTQMNDGLTLISAYLGFNKDITTKSARKTFADHNLNEDDTDIHTTAKMMGLASTQYLKHYANIDERRMIRELKLKPQPVHED